MYIHISIHKMRNMRTEIGQVMPVATAIMRISAFIAMRLLRGQGLITRHPVPVMMVRDNHRKQCQDAGHQHHVLYNPLFHFLTHGTKIRIFFRFLHECCKFAVNKKIGVVWRKYRAIILYRTDLPEKRETLPVLFLRRERLDYHDLHDRFRDHDPCAPFTAEFFHFCILYGIIHGVDHNGILILETRKNRWELRIEN